MTRMENLRIPALEAGVVEQTILDKPTSRLQRYRITALGCRL